MVLTVSEGVSIALKAFESLVSQGSGKATTGHQHSLVRGFIINFIKKTIKDQKSQIV
jgi:hypothetical protein